MKNIIGLILILASSILTTNIAVASSAEPDFADLYEEHSKSVVTVYTSTVTSVAQCPRSPEDLARVF